MAAFTGQKRSIRFKPHPGLTESHQRVDLSAPRMHKFSYLQNGARETGLGHWPRSFRGWLPGFLRSNDSSKLNFRRLTMPKEN